MKQILLLAATVVFSSLSYCQLTEVNNGYEKGRMRDNYKVGVWQYYDSAGVLELEVDYSTGTLNYLQRDTSTYVLFKDGKWVHSKVDIPPRYIGSWVDFYKILNESISYPHQAWFRDVVGKVQISFEVDTTGKATNFQVVKDIGCECAWEFERVLRLVPNYWLVAEIGGKPYRSRFLISCDYGILMDGKRLKERHRKKRKKDSDTLSIPLAKELNGIQYTIKKGYNPDK